MRGKWYQFYEIDSDKDNDNEELDKSDRFIESGDVTEYIEKGDIAITCTGDDHNYYLTKLITNINKLKNLKRMITVMRCLHIKKLSPALTWQCINT